MYRSIAKKRFPKAVMAVVAITALTSCSNGASSGGTSDEDRYGSAENPITLTFWSWGNGDAEQLNADYQEEHPHVTIENEIFGGSGDVYTKLGVVFKAGSGAPDLTSMELMNMPSFAAQGYLADLGEYGAEASDFSADASAAASFDGTLYAIPTDTGPLVMYYNTERFDELGIAVPTTWEEYRAAAEMIKASGTGFIANMDPGDPSLAMGLLQQAESHPFDLTGETDLTVDFGDEGARTYTDYWSGMLDDGLVDPDPAWSTEWFNKLADGTYATWLTGAWGGSVLNGSIPQAAGKWRVANPPDWDHADPSNGVWGGSSTVVTGQSEHPAAAAAFAEWFSTDQFEKNMADAANSPFPASTQVLDDPRYLDAASEFLGGQKPGAVYVAASDAVNSDWQFLPYQLYANTVYADTVGQHVDGDHDLAAGLEAWRGKIADYGTEQGFSVSGG